MGPPRRQTIDVIDKIPLGMDVHVEWSLRVPDCVSYHRLSIVNVAGRVSMPLTKYITFHATPRHRLCNNSRRRQRTLTLFLGFNASFLSTPGSPLPDRLCFRLTLTTPSAPPFATTGFVSIPLTSCATRAFFFADGCSMTPTLTLPIESTDERLRFFESFFACRFCSLARRRASISAVTSVYCTPGTGVLDVVSEVVVAVSWLRCGMSSLGFLVVSGEAGMWAELIVLLDCSVSEDLRSWVWSLLMRS